MRRPKFGLHVGMKDLDVIRELTRRSPIRSERTNQTLELFDSVRQQVDQKNLGRPVTRLEVVRANGSFAIMRHNSRRRHSDSGHQGWLEERSQHYLAGINDERRYFVRALAGIQQSELDSIGRTVSWLNRSDQGFTRVQGDVVMKSMPYRGNKARHSTSERYARYRLGLRASKASVLYGRQQSSPRMMLEGLSSDWSRPIRPSSYHNMFYFGEHTLSARGDGILAPAFSGTRLAEPLIVDGTNEVVLHHPEHETERIEIPEGRYAIVMTQRGAQPVRRLERGDRTAAAATYYD